MYILVTGQQEQPLHTAVFQNVLLVKEDSQKRSHNAALPRIYPSP